MSCRERRHGLRQKTHDDATLQDLKNIQIGWPEKKCEVLQGTRAYYNFCDKLSVQDDIIFKGERVVVPTVMRSEMLKKIHSSHIGTEGCLWRARETLFWPGMNAAIRENVSACNAYRTEQPKEPLIPQRVPDRAWSRVAVISYYKVNE